MSTSTKTYVMYGVKLPYSAKTKIEEDNDNEDFFYDAEESGKLEFDLVSDDMGGKFIMVGKILRESDEYGDIEDFNFIEESKNNRDFSWMIPAIKMFPQIESGDFDLRLFSLTS